MAKREQFYSELPHELKEAEELLHRYGRWAMDRFKPQRCASAEGHYKAPPSDEDRHPREVIMATADVERVAKALKQVPDRPRRVLMWLYVPDRIPVQAKMRKTGTPPREMREQHLKGVRIFWTLYAKPACTHNQAVDIASEQMYCPAT